METEIIPRIKYLKHKNNICVRIKKKLQRIRVNKAFLSYNRYYLESQGKAKRLLTSLMYVWQSRTQDYLIAAPNSVTKVDSSESFRCIAHEAKRTRLMLLPNVIRRMRQPTKSDTDDRSYCENLRL